MIMNLSYILKSFAWGMLLLMSVSACSAYEDSQMEEGAREYPVLLSVEEETSQGTKISVKGTTVAWEESDKLRLTAVPQDGGVGVSELTVYSIDQENAKKAVFSGVVNMTSMPEDCYFTYPYSAMEFDSENGKIRAGFTEQSGKHEPFLYGHSGYNESGMSAALKHVGAMLEIELGEALVTEGVSKISFAGNKLESLSPLIITPSDGSFDLPQEANKQITVDVQENAKTYICVPPINFEKGFSLVLSKADGSAMAKSFSSDGSLNGGYDFRNKAGHIIPIELDGSFVPFSIECSEPSWEHTKVNGLLTGTAVSFTLTKTGAPDKLIEEWGATLVNSEGVTVRKIKLTNADLKNGESVTMDVDNNWKLLPKGTYIFTPYYKMYGMEISMDAYADDFYVKDPEVKIEISGQTSYDKYKANQISDANSHSNSLISGVSVSVNVDNRIIDSFTADFNNKEITKNQLSDGTVSFGDLTKSAPKAYPLNVVMKVGELEVEASRDFHITGLPYEVNFQTSSQISGWTQNGVIIERGHYHFPNGTNYVISPKFHIPDNIDNINVDVSLGGWAYQGWTSSSAKAYIDVTSSVTAKLSGIDHSFSMDSWSTNPGNQQGETMSGQLILSQSDNRISICCVTSQGGGIPGISVGLYAKKFTLKYR